MEIDNKAIFEVVAARIVDSLGDAKGRDILTAGVASALTSYTFTSAVEKLVTNRAIEKVRAILESGAFDEAILAAIRDKMSDFMELLPAALPNALMTMFAGEEGSGGYGRGPGVLFKSINDARKAREERRERAKR